MRWRCITRPIPTARRTRRALTFAELKEAVDDCAGALRAMGIGPGDSVALYAPMRPETVAVMMASFRLGARFVPIFCGYGEAAVVERIESCQARVLFAVDHLHRRGKSVKPPVSPPARPRSACRACSA
jgi:acetyl-CoA synthetase